MHAPEAPGIEIGRVAFVSRRFQELQGLIPATFGAALIFSSLLAHAMPAGYAGILLQTWTLPTMVNSAIVVHLQRAYRDTFGDAVGSRRQQFMAAAPWLLVLLSGLVDMMAPTPWPVPSAAAVTLVGFSLMAVVRDWPWRIHHLVPAGAGMMAAAITASAPPLADFFQHPAPHRVEAYLLSFTLIGLGMVTSGLADHWLLASTLRARPWRPFDRAAALGRASSGLIVATLAALICVASGSVLWFAAPRYIAGDMVMVVVLTLLAAQMIFALTRVGRAVRAGTPAAAAPPVVVLRFGADSLVLFFAIALAAAVVSATGPRGVTVLVLAIGATSAWIAVRDWPARGYYLIGALTAMSVALGDATRDPARFFVLAMCAVSGAFTIQGLLDHLTTVRERRRSSSRPPGHTDADAV